MRRLFICVMLLVGCSRDSGVDVPSGSVPDILTSTLTGSTPFTAVCGGIITADGGSAVTARGVCWSVVQTPTVRDSITSDGSGLGSFTSTISGLSPNSTLYLRAYATNGSGTGYGRTVSFVTDIDGNIYHTVTLGTQVWMMENLRTTRYHDGGWMRPLTDGILWSQATFASYCWYGNDSTYKNTYGALYNWYAANSGKLAPTGWHVPSDADWKTLEMYLGMTKSHADLIGWRGTVGGKLKEYGIVHWTKPNAGANNSSGFTALPGGFRYEMQGRFFEIGDEGHWWCQDTDLMTRYLAYAGPEIGRVNTSSKRNGHSVRCVKD